MITVIVPNIRSWTPSIVPESRREGVGTEEAVQMIYDEFNVEPMLPGWLAQGAIFVSSESKSDCNPTKTGSL